MNNIDDNNNNYINNNDDINIKEDFLQSQEIVKRKIGRPPFIKTDKTLFKKEKKNTIIYFD
jgi:hypothetical protein